MSQHGEIEKDVGWKIPERRESEKISNEISYLGFGRMMTIQRHKSQKVAQKEAFCSCDDNTKIVLL